MPELILHLKDLQAVCTNCGELIEITGDLQIEQSGIIDCVKCSSPFLIGVLVQLFSQQQLKSNYQQMLGAIGVQKEIELYLQEIELENETADDVH